MHEFTSGSFARTAAWHGLGNVVTDEAQMSADYFFNDANAQFPVEEMELWAGSPDFPEAMIPMRQHRKAIWRPDRKHILGSPTAGYQIIPNSVLLDFAKRIEKEAQIDAVVVLREGAKVAFTAQLRDLTGVVVPGDEVKRNIVGFLGHDGHTGFGGMFTSVRVVCANTLGLAMHIDGRSGSGQFSIAHNAFEISQIDSILERIDFARQSFPETISIYQAMREVAVDDEEYLAFLNTVYAPPVVFAADGSSRPGDVLKDMPRKADLLMAAWRHGIGTDIPGVAGTAWAAFNAITEIEGRLPSEANNRRRFHSAHFGTGKKIIARAEAAARQLIGI